MEYIYNITFAVDASRESEMANSLQAEFLPLVTVGNLAHNPILSRVEGDMMTSDGGDDDTGEPIKVASLCLQVRFASRADLDKWGDEILPDGFAPLIKRFGENLLFFPTILQILEPHNFN